MKTRTHIDLFSGIGGFALAAQFNNVETKIFCEQNEHCITFLTAAWGLPIVRDIRNFQGDHWHGAWLLTAGVPCQPASRAGKQQGASDDRWLWPEAIRIAEESQPTWALFENPPGILDVGIDGILSELGRIGYESQPVSIPACAVNSPQDRERIWILAHRAEPGSQGGESELSRRQGGRASEYTQIVMGNTEDNNGRLLLQPRRQVEADAEPPRATQGGAVANGQGIGREARKRQNGKPRTSQTGQSRLEHQRTRESELLANSGEQPSSQPDEKDGALSRHDARLGSVRGAWADCQWIRCEKDKVRRFPNRLHSLGDGVSSRILEALGNAIVWPVAAEIIAAMIKSEEQP